MIKKLIGTFVMGMLFAAHANAATLFITGPGDVTVDDAFQIEIWGGSFPEGLGAGGILLSWDSSLVQFDLLTVNPALGVDPDFSCPGSGGCPPNDFAGGSMTIVWGTFATGGLIAPDGPDTLLATLDFTAIASLGEGINQFDMVSNSVLAGGWFNPGVSAIITDPDFVGLTQNVNAVPLPAAVWFMIGGLGTLLGFRRK